MSEPGQAQSPLESWLALQCESIPGADAGLVVIRHPAGGGGLASTSWPPRTAASPRLKATLEIARARGEVSAQETAGERASTCVAIPLLKEGECVGAVGVSLSEAPAGSAKSVAESLGRASPGLELLLDLEAQLARTADFAPALCSLVDEEQLGAAAHSFASWLGQQLGCERVSIGVQHGAKLEVVALTSNLNIAQESDSIRDLRIAMEEAVDQDCAIELPVTGASPPHEVTAHEVLLGNGESEVVRTVPLAAHGEAVGAITCEWSEAASVGGDERNRLEAGAVIAGPILALMRRAEATAIERLRTWIDDRMRSLFGSDSGAAKLGVAGVAAFLLCLTLLPADYRVSASATLEGRIQRALVAPVEGYLAEAHARAGDLVSKGAVLARLDDRDLRLEERKWQSQKDQLGQEYREALADQDRTRVSILRAQIEKAEAELALVGELLQRTEVVAPFDGIVLKGDLDRALGSPLEQGAVLFEIAPLDGYRIIVEVDERDIADVSVGQTGRLVLSALPGETLHLAVDRITPISNAEEGRNHFRVEATLEEPLAVLRPGMEGVAKIDAGERRLLWIWTHGLLDWLRLWTWSFVP